MIIFLLYDTIFRPKSKACIDGIIFRYSSKRTSNFIFYYFILFFLFYCQFMIELLYLFIQSLNIFLGCSLFVFNLLQSFVRIFLIPLKYFNLLSQFLHLNLDSSLFLFIGYLLMTNLILQFVYLILIICYQHLTFLYCSFKIVSLLQQLFFIILLLICLFLNCFQFN